LGLAATFAISLVLWGLIVWAAVGIISALGTALEHLR
jgi:hypothetical protein